MQLTHHTKAIGTGLLVICIWAGWITISRLGVQSHLTPADITLLRYITAGLCSIPFGIHYRITWKKIIQGIPMALGVGFPYTLLSFYALKQTQAANAGVLVNGLLPVFTALFSLVLFKETIPLRRVVAILGIFIANTLMITGGTSTLFSLAWVMLITAAIVYTIHIISVRAFQFHYRDILIITPLINVILFTPLFFLFESHLTTAPLSEIVLQSFYQGVVVNMIAISCVAYTIKHLGSTTTSLFMSFVPSVTALLAFFFLGEQLTPQEIISIMLCSGFLFLYNYKKRH
ncbi:MAG: DMT family transporter [Fibrobacterales bacterium]